MQNSSQPQVTDLQEQTQEVLNAVRNLLEDNKTWILKEWFVVIACELMAAHDPDSSLTKHISAPCMDARIIYQFWNFFCHLKSEGITYKQMTEICSQHAEKNGTKFYK